MLCLAAKAWARDASRAATAVTTTSGLSLAGLTSAAGAMRAAPRIPIRSGVWVPDTDPTLALGLVAGSAAGECRGPLRPDSHADEIGGQERQPRQPLHHAEEGRRRCRVLAAQQPAEQHPLPQRRHLGPPC